MRTQPWKLAILLNGKGDEMEYRKGNLATGGLPFDELKLRAYINPTAKAADDDPDFSARIRADRPGLAQSLSPPNQAGSAELINFKRLEIKGPDNCKFVCAKSWR